MQTITTTTTGHWLQPTHKLASGCACGCRCPHGTWPVLVRATVHWQAKLASRTDTVNEDVLSLGRQPPARRACGTWAAYDMIGHDRMNCGSKSGGWLQHLPHACHSVCHSVWCGTCPASCLCVGQPYIASSSWARLKNAPASAERLRGRIDHMTALIT